MRILVVILFMLLPFTLTVMLPSTVVHAHELTPDSDHHDNDHDRHHHDKNDCPKGDSGTKRGKFHSHDGQVAEYLVRDHLVFKQDEKAALPPPQPNIIYSSRTIKPPLEPPSVL